MAKENKYSFSAEPDGSNTTLMIGALLVFIILIGGALLFVLGQRITPPPSNETQIPPSNQTILPSNNTNGTVSPPCDDQCLYQLGVSNKNLSACLSMTNQSLRQNCFTTLSSGSLDACRLIIGNTTRESCILSFALSGKNISLCSELHNSTACRSALDTCYGRTDQEICRALRDNNAAECNHDTSCLLNYSISMKNASSCPMIQNDVVVNACFSALSQHDRCSDLTSMAQRDYCYDVWGVYSNNYLICTQISESNSYMIDCLSQTAANAHNYTLCKVDGMALDDLWACYINYSLITGDLSGCYQIDALAPTNRYKCASSVAQKYGNPSACEVITDTLGQRSTCYQGAIIYNAQNLNWVNCANVTDFNWKNKCYVESAKKFNNIALCDYIDADFARTSCRDSYNLYQAGK